MAIDRNPWSEEHWDPVAQANYIRKHGMHRATIRAREAGNTVHGTRPHKAKAKTKPGVLTEAQTKHLQLIRRKQRGQRVASISAAIDLGLDTAADVNAIDMAAAPTLGLDVAAEVSREIDIILFPGIKTFSAHFNIGAAERAAIGEVTPIYPGDFALGITNDHPTIQRSRNISAHPQLGLTVPPVAFGDERQLSLEMGLGVDGDANINEAHLIANAGLGFAEFVAASKFASLEAHPALGVTESQIFSNTKFLNASLGLGIDMDATIARLIAGMGLGVSQTVTFDNSVSIAAQPQLGLSEAATVIRESFSTAAPSLGLTMVPNIYIERNTTQDMTLGYSMQVQPTLPYSLVPGTFSLGVSEAAVVQRERDLVAAASLGISEASTVTTIAPAMALTYKGEDHQNNLAQSVFTFTSKAIGTASADRWVFVLFTAKNAAARTLTGITIGGVAATIETIVGTITQTTGYAGIAFANVPSGTTANIVMSFSGGNFTASTANGVGIDWYTVVGNLNTTATDTFSDNTVNSPVTKTFSVPSGGVAFVLGEPTNASRAVTGDFTADDNFVQYIAGGQRFAGSVANATGGALNKVFTATSWSSSGNLCPKIGRAYAHN